MESKPCSFLVTKQLYRVLLPLLVARFMHFREKHGKDREGFVMELKRLNVLDEPEMERITHGYFLSKEPTLIWLIEWTLTYDMRQVFDVYGIGPDFPYVLIHPYRFIGHLFQVIAGQWLIKQGAELTVHEMDKFLKVCLQEHLERNVPIVPHNSTGPVERNKDWRAQMFELHQRLWSEFPDLRDYIRYHVKWFQKQDALPSEIKGNGVTDKTGLSREIKLLQKTISDLAEVLKSVPKVAPHPQQQQQQQPAGAAAVTTAEKKDVTAPTTTTTTTTGLTEKKQERRRRKHGRRESSSSSSSSSSDDDNDDRKSTITAKLHSDDDDEREQRGSGSSSSSSSDSD